MEKYINTFREMIADSDNIVFFGGAGVSTESGIPDFRSASGLYRQDGAPDDEFRGYAPEEILHARFFRSNTKLFFRYYFTKFIYPNAEPNAAHRALAALEKTGKLKAVVTQNIDGLHQKAGSRNVFELHGSIHRNYCQRCAAQYSLDDVLKTAPETPVCTCGGVIKPDVVLYGETLREDCINDAVHFISEADMLIVGGTSLSVYPAAGLVGYYRGKRLVLINRDETPYDKMAALVFRDKLGEVLNFINN